MSDALPAMEHLEPDKYLGPRRFRIHARCDRCGTVYHWTTTTLSGKDKPCPDKTCQEAARREEILREARNLAQIFLEQRAPATIGDNPRNNAIDKTADIVMTDYGLTNLQDNIREGDVIAPKLPTVGESGMKLNEAADKFFSGDALKREGMSRQAQILGAQAIAGSFANMAANPARLTAAKKGAPPLTLVRTEKIG